MKKVLSFLFILFVSVFAISCNEKEKYQAFIDEYSYYCNEENVKDGWDWFNKEEFQKALELKRVKKITCDELFEKLDSKETFVIWYGFDPELYQCPYCVASLPVAINAFNEIDLDIYYLDIYAMRNNNTDEYQRILKQLQEDENFGEKILVPTYVSYRDGDVYKYHVATLKDENDKYIKDLSDNQKEELKQIYLDLVK